MAIRPVTFPGAANFKSTLYALEVKSRFIDQNAANGYYTGYGDELSAIISSNEIRLGSGAFLVQGRMVEIDAGGASITVPIQNGYFGYLCARIETYHPNDTENCTLVIKTGITLAGIEIVQESTFGSEAENENKVYELPLYSFKISNGAITDLKKAISPIKTVERYTHYIYFEFQTSIASGATGKIYCDIAADIPTTVTNGTQLIDLIKKAGGNVGCRGYYYDGGNFPFLLEYYDESTITLKSLNTEGVLVAKSLNIYSNVGNITDKVV